MIILFHLWIKSLAECYFPFYNHRTCNSKIMNAKKFRYRERIHITANNNGQITTIQTDNARTH